jgi:hypothetical protein
VLGEGEVSDVSHRVFGPIDNRARPGGFAGLKKPWVLELIDERSEAK